MNAQVHNLLCELRTALDGLYRERLRGVYLFGSYARGDYDVESDVDVLIVLDDFVSHVAEIDRTSRLASELSLKYGLSVSTVFIREADWLAGDLPFLRNVRDEVMAVWVA